MTLLFVFALTLGVARVHTVSRPTQHHRLSQYRHPQQHLSPQQVVAIVMIMMIVMMMMKWIVTGYTTMLMQLLLTLSFCLSFLLQLRPLSPRPLTHSLLQ